MTSWSIVTYLIVWMSLITPSKENCSEYLEMEIWDAKSLGQSFILMHARDPTDVVKCTVEYACNTTKNPQPFMCAVLDDCLKLPQQDRVEPWTCEGQSSQNISFYHLMCLTAKAAGFDPRGCKYENVCKLDPKIRPIDQTTALPTTTATLSPATTTLSPSTTVLPSMTATTPGTTTVKQGEVSDGNASHLNGTAVPKNGTGASTVMCWLIISIILNIVLPTAVYLFMRRKTQDRTHGGKSALDGDPENVFLQQEPECDPVDSPSADTTRTASTAGHRSSPWR